MQRIFFQIMKTMNYRGDLTDITANKEALSVTSSLLLRIPEHPHLCCYCSVDCFKTTMTNEMCLNVEREYGTLSPWLLIARASRSPMYPACSYCGRIYQPLTNSHGPVIHLSCIKALNTFCNQTAEFVNKLALRQRQEQWRTLRL